MTEFAIAIFLNHFYKFINRLGVRQRSVDLETKFGAVTSLKTNEAMHSGVRIVS